MMLNDDNAGVPWPPKISREAGICKLFRLIDTCVFTRTITFFWINLYALIPSVWFIKGQALK